MFAVAFAVLAAGAIVLTLNVLLTTGLLEFVECPKHSANHLKYSANGSPSVTFGEQHSPKNVTAKPTLPSVFYWTLGKAFAECPTLGKAFAECPTLGEVGTKKTRKNWNFYSKKMENLF